MERKIIFDFSIKSVFTVVFGLIILWVMFYLRDIIVLFFLAFILATAVDPLVSWLERKKIPRLATVIGIFIVAALGLYGLVRLIVPPISNQVNHIVDNRHVITERLVSYLNDAPEAVRNAIYDFSNELPQKITKYSSSNSVVTGAFGVFSGILGFVTFVVISLYLLFEHGSMENLLREYWPSRSREKAIKIFKEIVEKISLWARGQLILSGSIGLLTFIGLTILRIDYALTLAVIAGISELLPIVGPFVGAVPAILVAFMISPILALWTAVLYLGIQQFENHILVPQVMKRAVGLSPVVIIFSLLAGARLLGLIGVIIAVPVASAVAVLIKHSKKEGI